MARVFRFVGICTLCFIAAAAFERAWSSEILTSDEGLVLQFHPRALQFGQCAENPQFECGQLTLPVDYLKPDAETFFMDVIRAAATKPARRIGVLIQSPGGPDTSGIAQVLGSAGEPAFERMRQRFDIVSFEPRGIGSLSASRVARDLDTLRRALHEEQISLLTSAHGSSIGAIYASLFPERVRAMVLDAPRPAEAHFTEAGVPGIRDVSALVAHPILIIDIDIDVDRSSARNHSRELARRLGMEDSLIRYAGTGHTAFPAANSVYSDLAVEAYLFDLALPAAGLRCPAQPIHF